MQNADVQHMEGEEGSIGATGALASSLGSVIANPLESADLPSTGIPFVSTNDETLPAVEGSVPSTPAASFRHGSVSGSPSTQTRAQSTPARQRRNNPLRADSSLARPGNTLPGETADGETGQYLDPMTAARLNSLSSDLFALRQKMSDLEKTVASVVPAAELEQRNRHSELKDTVSQALVEFGSKFEIHDQAIHDLTETNTELRVRLAEACEVIQQQLRDGVAQHDISTPQPNPQPPG